MKNSSKNDFTICLLTVNNKTTCRLFLLNILKT